MDSHKYKSIQIYKNIKNDILSSKAQIVILNTVQLSKMESLDSRNEKQSRIFFSQMCKICTFALESPVHDNICNV